MDSRRLPCPLSPSCNIVKEREWPSHCSPYVPTRSPTSCRSRATSLATTRTSLSRPSPLPRPSSTIEPTFHSSLMLHQNNRLLTYQYSYTHGRLIVVSLTLIASPLHSVHQLLPLTAINLSPAHPSIAIAIEQSITPITHFRHPLQTPSIASPYIRISSHLHRHLYTPPAFLLTQPFSTCSPRCTTRLHDLYSCLLLTIFHAWTADAFTTFLYSFTSRYTSTFILFPSPIYTHIAAFTPYLTSTPSPPTINSSALALAFILHHCND